MVRQEMVITWTRVAVMETRRCRVSKHLGCRWKGLVHGLVDTEWGSHDVLSILAGNRGKDVLTK